MTENEKKQKITADMTMEERWECYRSTIAELTIRSDIFARNVLKEKTCTEYLLETILGEEKVTVLEQVLQMDYKNLQGRSAILDCVARDRKNRIVNIEIQNEGEGASPERARYHSGLLDMNTLKAGQNFEELPEKYVIFITRDDTMKMNLPIYDIRRKIVNTGKSFADNECILYVNAKIQDDTRLGKLMHDLHCKKADEMYPFLKDKRKYTLDKETKIELFKNTKAMMMHKIGTVVVNSTDNIVLSSFVGLTAVGLYSNYYLVIYALTLITDQLYNSVKSSIGNLYAIEDSNKSYDIFKKLDFLTFWISACCTCCMISLYNPFITIWVGEQYLFSMDIVIAIVINFYLKLMRKSILSFREAAGLFYKDRWKPILESVVNLVVSIILAKKIGTLGVFIGTIVSYVFICIWVEVYVLYRYGFKKSIKIYFKNYFIELTIVIILCLLTFSACYLIPQAGLVGFVIKVIICFCIPNVILYFVYRNSNEFKYFKKLFFKIFKKLNHINIKHSIN